MLLFNIAGYYFVFSYFIERSNRQLVQQLDNDQYNESELIELKVAMHLPYVTGSGNYERVDGEIELNGRHYNYVKRKVQQDTLFLLCLPNKNKTELLIARSEYAGKVNDFPSGENSRALVKKYGFSNEYRQSFTGWHFISPEISTLQQTLRFSPQLLSSFIEVEHGPPKYSLVHSLLL